MAEEADLMGRYCDGDAGAFRALYALVAPRLLGYLTRMAGDRPAAEDILQQTFLKVHRARAAYVRGANPMPWLYAIARRTFLDDVRRRGRSGGHPRSHDGAREPVASLLGNAVGLESSRHDEVPEPELVAAALAELQKLPPAQREAVVLTKLDGKSIAEAAEIAGTTTGALKVRAHRGYAALRRALATADDER
jgi:RNA polymerase sigma-70 factor, ECF subfamily